MLRPGKEPQSKSGVIVEMGAETYTIRLRLPAGQITPARMRRVAEIADQYGTGELHLTTRQTIEISHLTWDQVADVSAALEENGTPVGAEYEAVVNVTSCPGSERCRLANIDSVALAREIDLAHFGKHMPVKTRIAVSSCPNSCASERLNEIGVTGLAKPIRDPGLCTGCGTCVEYCRENALDVINGTIVLNDDLCIRCGSCIHTCPYGIIKSEPVAYRITVGGRRGRHPVVARDFVMVNSPEAVLQVIDRIVYWIYRQAWSGKLLPEQLDDLSFDSFREEMISSLPPDILLSEY